MRRVHLLDRLDRIRTLSIKHVKSGRPSPLLVEEKWGQLVIPSLPAGWAKHMLTCNHPDTWA